MKTAWKIVILFVALSLVGVGYFSFSSITGKVTEVGAYDSLAHCLTEKGAVFYGSFQCSHCKTQKELFGDSMRYVNYVECGPLGAPPTNKECIQSGIRAYPTWIIDGKKYEGVQSLDKLSELTSCKIAQ